MTGGLGQCQGAGVGGLTSAVLNQPPPYPCSGSHGRRPWHSSQCAVGRRAAASVEQRCWWRGAGNKACRRLGTHQGLPSAARSNILCYASAITSQPTHVPGGLVRNDEAVSALRGAEQKEGPFSPPSFQLRAGSTETLIFFFLSIFFLAAAK